MGTMAEYLEVMKNDPLEYKRQSGRTTRMFQRAVDAAKSGKMVVVLMKDMNSVNHWQDRIGGPVPGLSIEGMKFPTSPEIDWKEFKLIGLRSDHQLFIDHDVFESTFKYILKAWTVDDLPIDQLRQFA